MMKRVMCIYLPLWPLQRLWHVRQELRDKPVAIVRPAARGDRVILCSKRAAQAGVRPGMTAAEAKAVASQVVLHPEDAAADVKTLRRMATWAERYSPIVGLEEGDHPECLLLDITGCSACFHGEDRLGQLALRELTDRRWFAHIAIADTRGAAWGLAHYMAKFCVVPPGDTANAVLLLPVAALRLPDETLETLKLLGIERIGQLAELPRHESADRFGALVMERLDQALGDLPELIVPHRSPPEVDASRAFEYPIEQRQALHYVLVQLLDEIEEMLRLRHGGGRLLECWLYHEKATPVRIDVRLFRPARSARHLGNLLRTQLEQVQLAAPITGVRLRVPIVETIAEHQLDLFDEGAPSVDALPLLIDQLASRMGRDAVTFATLQPDPQPEYACRFEPAVSFSHEPTASARPALAVGSRLNDGDRPLRLLPTPVELEVIAVFPEGPPVRLRWAGTEYTVRKARGPERIETGWWRGQDIHRDYYVVETEGGTRLWVFRRMEDGRWFLHGCFD